MDPWNQWTYLFFALTALCLGLAWAAPAALGRGARAPRPGLALVPAAALYVIAFGIYMPSWALEQGGTVASGRTVVTGDSLLANASQPRAFWLSVAIVTVAAVLTLVAPRLAGYLAAASLLAFGFWEAWVTTHLHLDIILSGSRYWYDFLLGASNRSVVGVSALASVAAGLFLTQRTIVADVRARRGGLTAQVQRLAVTRADAIDTAAAELRRLERDLHDGAQARLVSLGINLRAAEKLVRTSPDAAEALIVECRETSSRALAELRDLVRGIYPPVLADRGLADAVRAIAIDCAIPVETEISLDGRPPAPVESAVYFAVAEILSNVTRHAGASSAIIQAEHHRGMLHVEVTDDGVGGADSGKGTGLSGIEGRLAVFDGILAVISPAGGPTTVVIEVPCALSSPKISTS